MQINLKAKAKVTKICRPSKSACFEDLQVGDVISFAVTVQHVGRNSKGSKPVYIFCRNERTIATSNYSFNQIGRILECCELEEMEDKE